MPLSLKLSDEEVRKLKSLVKLEKLDLQSPNEYEVLRIHYNGIFLVLYTSNKLVYEDTSETKKILDFVLEKKNELKYYIGSDETGKGEWYGPLVIVGTCLTADQITELRKIGVRDSKTLPIEKIFELAEKMLELDIPRISRVLLPEKYNKLYEEFKSEGKNLNDLLAWAHSEIIKDLIEKFGSTNIEVVIDKFDFRKTDSRLSARWRERRIDQSKIEVIQKSKGESEIPVAAASVIAKSIFEKEVAMLSNKFHIDLKTISPENVPKDALTLVAKTHFQNIRKLL